MRFLTLILILSCVGFQFGCEEPMEPEPSPIDTVLPDPVSIDPEFHQPCMQDSDYECGIILVQYDEETWAQQTFPIPAMNKFLKSKGYIPEVTDIFADLRVEVIYIGDYDIMKVLEEIHTVSGVVFAQPSFLYSFEIDDVEPD